MVPNWVPRVHVARSAEQLCFVREKRRLGFGMYDSRGTVGSGM